VRLPDARRRRYWRSIVRAGPTEIGYAYFRARRRRRDRADDAPVLAEGEALARDPALDATPAELAANARTVAAWRAAPGPRAVRNVQWFVPWFHNPWGGGIHTALRIADHAARVHGAESRFHLYDRSDPGLIAPVRARIAAAFPALAAAPITVAGEPIGATDAAFATSWTSAYRVLRHTEAPAKFFLVQDFEPAFHPAGSASALLGEAARLGLPAVVNTPGLADAYRAEGGIAVAFTPAVDGARFHPPATPAPEPPTRVVFYGRPRTARNAFVLGTRALAALKARLGDRVEIVCAGEDWNPGAYGLHGVLRNLGALQSMDAVAELYRSAHVGLVLMLTRHPSYQPFEFAASGMAVVSNANPWTGWLLRHEETALLAPPLPSLLADQLARAVEDRALRARVAAGGRAAMTATTWEAELEHVWRAVTKDGVDFS